MHVGKVLRGRLTIMLDNVDLRAAAAGIVHRAKPECRPYAEAGRKFRADLEIAADLGETAALAVRGRQKTRPPLAVGSLLHGDGQHPVLDGEGSVGVGVDELG